MDAVPLDAMRVAGTAAVSCVVEIKVVASGLPFQVTVLAAVKPVPLTVRVNAGPPGETVEGEMLVRVSVEGLVMLKGSEAGCGCPVTLTPAVPAVVSNAAGTDAVS